MPSAVPALRLALAALLAAQPDLAEPAASTLRRAAALRLSDAERADEAAVDALRARLRASTARVEVVDYGAGTRGGTRPPERRVADIVRRAATGPAWGRFLYGLARAATPRRVLELGTNLGVSAAHLGLALARTADEGRREGRLVTLEGAPALADLSRLHLAELGLARRVDVVTGRFADTLPGALASGPFDLAFIDGHHEEEAAVGYAEAIRPHLVPGALLVLDDVEPGRPVRRAWRRLRAAHPGDTAVWLGKLGVIAVGFPQTSTPKGAATDAARDTVSTALSR